MEKVIQRHIDKLRARIAILQAQLSKWESILEGVKSDDAC